MTVAPPRITPDRKIVGQPVARHDAVERYRERA